MTDRRDLPPPPAAMCGVCHLILTPMELDGRLTYSHGHLTDHEPVLVAVEDPAYRCDFCSAPDPKWSALCTPFLMSAEQYAINVEAQDDGAWACCDACASYIRRNDWPRLLYRATKNFAWPPGYVEGGNLIARLHDEFRHHFTGVITPL